MPKGVYTRTAETRKKMSEAKKGKSLRHGGSFKKGHPPYLFKHSEETKKKISLKNKGKPASAGSFKKGHKRIDNGRTLCVPCHQKTDTYKKRLKIKCYV